jgi:hypothetical protein
MLENILGWSVIVAFPVGVIFGLYKLIKYRKRIADEREAEEYAQALERAKQARERERQRAKEREEWQARLDGKSVKSTYDFNNNTVKTAVKDKKTNTTSYVTTPAESVSSPINNWSTDLLTTMIITDLLTNHKDVSAGTVNWKDNTPTIKETYSKPSTDFGFDDSDSRKSSSSSFSSSDSSSSWSDSSSSSSDSGPSSDW